mmetsp:Transcript_48672/g.162415  ORF Transcript_48672/g.162415 Transcript_48672/m.162415 type:complete len:289 (-) Transcript_48672:3184-4050(-)
MCARRGAPTSSARVCSTYASPAMASMLDSRAASCVAFAHSGSSSRNDSRSSCSVAAWSPTFHKPFWSSSAGSCERTWSPSSCATSSRIISEKKDCIPLLACCHAAHDVSRFFSDACDSTRKCSMAAATALTWPSSVAAPVSQDERAACCSRHAAMASRSKWWPCESASCLRCSAYSRVSRVISGHIGSSPRASCSRCSASSSIAARSLQPHAEMMSAMLSSIFLWMSRATCTVAGCSVRIAKVREIHSSTLPHSLRSSCISRRSELVCPIDDASCRPCAERPSLTAPM